MAKDIGIIIFCLTFIFFRNWSSHRSFQFMNAEIVNLNILFFVFLLSAKQGDWQKRMSPLSPEGGVVSEVLKPLL